MKKFLCCAMAVCMLALLFAGCASTSGVSPSGASPAGGSTELNLFIWTEYMPDSVLQKFSEETGINVNISTYSSNEDLLAKVKASNTGLYDIVVPSDYMVKMMVEQGLLAELDKDKLTNLGSLGSQYLDQSYDPGNAYSVPFMGGVAAYAVNTSMVDEDITTCSQIFDPKYESSIVMLDDFRAVTGMVAKSMGYSFNETDPATLDKISERLMELKPNVKALDSDSPKSLMISGETSIGYMWNAEVALSIAENPDIKIVYPEEGCYLFMDNLCVLKGAKNAENAEKFIDFILRPDVSKMISEEFPYLNPNTKAIELLGEAYVGNPAINIPADVIAKGEYIQDVGDAVEQYNTIWTEFTN
jgi:spermidine/putrescine transport system permease protein